MACVSALLLASCGGGSGGSGASAPGPLKPAGKITLVKSAVATAAGISLTDGLGVTVTGVSGSIAPGATVRVTDWSLQRPQAVISTIPYFANAVDITVAPGSINGSGALTVTMPWKGTGDPTGTCLYAYGPSGSPLVLSRTSTFSQSAPQVTLTASDVAFLGGVQSNSGSPVEFEIVTEQLPVSATATGAAKIKPELKLIWRAPARRTTAATRQRIAVTIHGVLNTSADVEDLTRFMRYTKQPTEGNTSSSSYPFDLVYTYNYDWTDTIEHNGEAFAAKMNSLYSDPSKYEVHVFGHSMGGMVARWAVEQSIITCCTHLVTMGSPSKGVPFDVVLEWVHACIAFNFPAAYGLDIRLAPGPIELVEGSALLNTLRNSTVPSGVTFQAIGGTNPNLPTGGYLIAAATVAICARRHRLPCDGFVPLDSSLGNFATSKLSVPYNHSDLCTFISTYWPGSTAETWVPGINRQIAKLVIPAVFYKLDVDALQAVEVVADDADGDKLDPDLLFNSTLPNPAQAPLQWSSSDPTIITFSDQHQLSVNLKGLKAGTATVTVKDPTSGTSSNVLVQVGPGNVLITPANKTVAPGSVTTYTVGLVTGSIPSGTQITWSIRGNGLVNGRNSVTTTSPTVTFTAPTRVEQDVISVELKNSGGTVLGLQSTPINIGAPLVFTPDNPLLATSEQTAFTVANGDGSSFPANSTFKWSVTGSGNLAGGNPVVTSTPTVQYTAPSRAETETLTVKLIDSSGAVLNTGTNTITVSSLKLSLAPNPWTFKGYGDWVTVTVASSQKLPSGVTYRWSCSKGNLTEKYPALKPQQTFASSTPSVCYTDICPVDGSTSADTVKVQAVDSRGNLLGQASETFNLGGNRFQVTIYNNGNYGSWFEYSPGYEACPVSNRVSDYVTNYKGEKLDAFFVGSVALQGNNSAPIFQPILIVPGGHTPSAGDSFTVQYYSYLPYLTPYIAQFSGSLINNVTFPNDQPNGSFKIISSSPDPRGGTFIGYTFDLKTVGGDTTGFGVGTVKG